MTDLHADPPNPLRVSQVARLIVIGALLWFLAAIILRFVGPMGAFEGFNRLLTYALVIPGTVPFLLLSVRLAGLVRGQIVAGVAVITAAAALLDGVALAWFPALYGTGAAQLAGSGAAILWGVGVGLVLALYMDRPARG